MTGICRCKVNLHFVGSGTTSVEVAALRGNTRHRQPTKPANSLPIILVPWNILKAHPPHRHMC